MEKIKSLLRSPKFFIVAGLFFFVLITLFFLLRTQNNLPTRDTDPTQTLIAGEDYVTGQIVVKFKESVTAEEINEILSRYDAKVLSKIEAIDATVIEVPRGRELEIQNALVENPAVEYSEPDFIGEIEYTPNDTDFGLQWGLSNKGQDVNGQTGTSGVDIDVERAWDVTRGQGVKVAVLDTGLDFGHPEFEGKVVAQKSFNGNIPDGHGHGTHTTGIIGANTNNDQGIAGVCPDCQLIVVKAADDQGKDSSTTIANSLIWAADQGAKVISISLGNYEASNIEADAIAYAWEKGAVIIASAGNKGEKNIDHYPSDYENVISVASSDNRDGKASSSNYGDNVDVTAPGVSIYSTWKRTVPALNIGGYKSVSGTSMSAPHVSGVAALVWSTQYGTTNQAVVERIFATTDKINGTGTYWKYGRVNAAKAVGVGDSPSSSPSLSPSPSVLPSVSPSVTVTTSPPPGVIAPTFVCAGSTTNYCGLPVLPSTTITQNPSTTITGTQPSPSVSVIPSVSPTVTQIPAVPPNINNPQSFLSWIFSLISSILGRI